MPKTIFNRTKPHLTIGTIGRHVDHGKTALTAAITHYLAENGLAERRDLNQFDTLPEEKELRVTVQSAHVQYETESRFYTHIDCPGHPDYVEELTTGAAQMDGAILVVSDDDGPRIGNGIGIEQLVEGGLRR